jgi:hypothetical protein
MRAARDILPFTAMPERPSRSTAQIPFGVLISAQWNRETPGSRSRTWHCADFPIKTIGPLSVYSQTPPDPPTIFNAAVGKSSRRSELGVPEMPSVANRIVNPPHGQA